MIRRLLPLISLIALLWLAAPAAASASVAFVFQTDMHGENVVPPVSSGAWGFVRFFFNDARTEADYTVDVKGLSNTLVEGADMFRGSPGANGALFKHLAGGDFIVTSGHLALSPSELDEFIAGEFYVVLYTKAHPEGELRGQVYVPSGFVPGTSPDGTDPLFNGIPAPVAPQPAVVIAAPAEPNRPTAVVDAAAPAPARPAAAPGTITPPNTGNGGLAGAGIHPARAVMLGLAAAIIGVGLMFASGYSRR